jgi:hypothetical protein
MVRRGVEESPVEGGVYVAGDDGVDADSEVGPFQGRRLGEPDQTVFGRAVGSESRYR